VKQLLLNLLQEKKISFLLSYTFYLNSFFFFSLPK